MRRAPPGFLRGPPMRSVPRRSVRRQPRIRKDTALRTIDRILRHCSATPEGGDVGIDTIRGWHVDDNGRSDIGHHHVIELDGTRRSGRPDSEIGAHVHGHNADSIGICHDGGRLSAEGHAHAGAEGPALRACGRSSGAPSGRHGARPRRIRVEGPPLLRRERLSGGPSARTRSGGEHRATSKLRPPRPSERGRRIRGHGLPRRSSGRRLPGGLAAAEHDDASTPPSARARARPSVLAAGGGGPPRAAPAATLRARSGPSPPARAPCRRARPAAPRRPAPAAGRSCSGRGSPSRSRRTSSRQRRRASCPW